MVQNTQPNFKESGRLACRIYSSPLPSNSTPGPHTPALKPFPVLSQVAESYPQSACHLSPNPTRRVPNPKQLRSKEPATSIPSACDIDPKCVRHRPKVRATSTQSACDCDPSACDIDPKCVRHRPKVRATATQSACDIDPKCSRHRPEVHTDSTQSPCNSGPNNLITISLCASCVKFTRSGDLPSLNRTSPASFYQGLEEIHFSIFANPKNHHPSWTTAISAASSVLPVFKHSGRYNAADFTPGSKAVDIPAPTHSFTPPSQAPPSPAPIAIRSTAPPRA